MEDPSRSPAIKGPGLRLDIDLRRVWKCPECDRVKRTTGHVTAMRCHRSKCNHAWMRLLDPPGREPKGLQIDLAAKLAAREAEEATSKPVIDADAAMAAVSVVKTPSEPPSEESPTSEGPETVTSLDEEPTALDPAEPPAEPTSPEPSDTASETNPDGPPKKRRRRRSRRGRSKEGRENPTPSAESPPPTADSTNGEPSSAPESSDDPQKKKRRRRGRRRRSGGGSPPSDA